MPFPVGLVFLANGKDVSLEIKEVEGTEKASSPIIWCARYRGLTPGGKPYEITAALANEFPTDQAELIWTSQQQSFTLRNGSIVNLKSDVGVFNKQTNIVTMSGAL